MRIATADEPNLAKDEELAWKYFDELKFDIIFSNPPFAGEMRDKKMLVHYDLAKPALRRAKDKQAKEERDVLFIERILKFLKPGGRAAIVLPQGKFNNSSLAFIREWILHKARLLAVVGLHANTFKPHTGTKTSVLFIRKYQRDELQNIEAVKQSVAAKCPDYAKMIRSLLAKHQYASGIPEEEIPEAITELLTETFNAGDEESAEPGNADAELWATDNPAIVYTDDRVDAAGEKIAALKNQLIQAKQKLIDLGSDLEALALKHERELAITGKSEKAALKTQHREEEKAFREKQKDEQKLLRAEIKALDAAIPEAEYEQKLLTNKGKLQIVLEDSELIGILKNRWIDAEVARKLDYPIFMAVSERGGKNNSGDYVQMTDKDGSLMEFPPGHPQEGQPMIDQDLVNYNLTAEDLKNAAQIPADQLCIAEAFVRFARKHKFDFWEAE